MNIFCSLESIGKPQPQPQPQLQPQLFKIIEFLTDSDFHSLDTYKKSLIG